MTEFGVLKNLLIKKMPTEKIEALVVPQIHLTKVQSAGFFFVKRGEMKRGCLYKTQTTSRITLMIGMCMCKAKEKLLG